MDSVIFASGDKKGPFLFKFPGKFAVVFPFFAICCEIDFVRFVSGAKKGFFAEIPFRELSARGAVWWWGGGPDAPLVSGTCRVLSGRGAD